MWMTDDGKLVSEYHDTGIFSSPRTPLLDEKGNARCLGNRRLQDVLKQESSEEAMFRGNDAGKRAPPPFLRNALRCLVREPKTLQEFSALCSVQVPTAWSYAARVVEHRPHAYDLAERFVFPSLLHEVRALPDRTGSLTEVMGRLEETFRGDSDWGCVEDRFAHLRLARMCAEARENASVVVELSPS